MGILIPTVIAILASLVVVQVAPQNVSDVSCTITRYNSEDIKNAQRECNLLIINGIEVPAGETLDLSFMKRGASLVFRGIITWGYKAWRGPLINIEGSDLDISGATGHVLDGRGALYWDGKGDYGKLKPLFILAVLNNSRVHNLNIKNSPHHLLYIRQCENVVFQDIITDSSAGDVGGAGITEGFDIIDSANITIKGSTVYSQDNCLKVYSGNNIDLSNNYCSGGNGIFVLGGRLQHIIRTVKITNSEVTNSNYGIRLMTAYRGTGSVSDVTFQDITLSRIHKYGIAIEADYDEGTSTGVPTAGVEIRDLTMNNVHGSIESTGVNVYVLVENATNWYFSNVNLTGGQKFKKCQGIPPGAGISC